MLGVLLVATLVATVFPAALPLNGEAVFSSVAVLIATRLYGIKWGLVASLLAGVCALALWLPTATAVLFVAEVLVVGMLFKRGMRTIFLADLIFWTAFGLPLLWLFHAVLLQAGTDSTLSILVRHGGMGLFNGLMATLIFHFLPVRYKQSHTPVTLLESQFNLLLACFLLPTLLFMLINLYAPRDFVKPDLEAEMAKECLALGKLLHSQHKRLENTLMDLAPFDISTGGGANALQRRIDATRKKFPSLLAVVVADAEGNPVASSSAGNIPESLFGDSEASFAKVKKSQRPVFSEIQTNDALPAPYVVWSMPVTASGRISGFVRTVLDVRSTQRLLEEYPARSPFHISLLDSSGRVAASSDPKRQIMEDYFQKLTGTSPFASPATLLWQPQEEAFQPLSLVRRFVPLPFWKSLDPLEIPLNAPLPWGMAVEMPSARYLPYLQRTAARGLAIMLAPAGLAILLAWITNRRLIAPLAELRDASSNLPQKLTAGQAVDWPTTSTLEVGALTDNYRILTEHCNTLVSQLEQLQHSSRRATEQTSDALDDVLAQRNWEAFTTGRKLRVEVDRRKRIEGLISELEAAESKYRFLVEKSLVGVYTLIGERFAYINPRFAEIFGYSQREIEQTLTLLDLTERDDRVMVSGNLRRQELGEVGNLQYRFKGVRKDGSIVHVEVLNGKGTYEGKTAILGTLMDITGRVKAEETVEHMAYHDPLTGLPNRRLFADRVNQSLVYAERNRQMVGMIFLDLDRFKAVNDTLGHAAGDQLLKELASRLAESLRESDTISRFGGDEFNILVTQVKQESDVTLIAHKILRAMKFPFEIEGQEIFITCSIGIALYPKDCDDLEGLMKNADTALYRAKDLGRNNYQVYSPAMNAQALERMALESSLRRVLERNELRVHYQPQVDMRTGKIVGMEALVRWQHSIGEMIQPSAFIPLAEEIGLIAPIGEWVLRSACHQAKAWQRDGFPPLRVGVNVSARQLHDPDFSDVVTYIVNESGIDPKWINIEITESVVVEDAKEAISKFCQLHDVGITVAIDDFGIGYSSLSYLRDFPVDQLKIDRSFVQNLPHEANDANIARHIIEMAHDVGLTVIAEGVETKEQYEFLRSLGCDEAQGFLMSAPIPADGFARLLQEERPYDF